MVYYERVKRAPEHAVLQQKFQSHLEGNASGSSPHSGLQTQPPNS